MFHLTFLLSMEENVFLKEQKKFVEAEVGNKTKLIFVRYIRQTKRYRE